MSSAQLVYGVLGGLGFAVFLTAVGALAYKQFGSSVQSTTPDQQPVASGGAVARQIEETGELA